MVEKSKNQYSSNIIALSKICKANDKALDKAIIKHSTKQSESTVQSIDSIDIPIYNNTNLQIDNTPPTAKEKSFKNLSETEFYQTIKEFSEKYPSKMLREFFDYWREPMANKKMRMTGEKAWDLSRRLSTWNNRNSNKNSNGNNTINPTNTDGTRNLALARRR